jgi:hypothetical protein
VSILNGGMNHGDGDDDDDDNTSLAIKSACCSDYFVHHDELLLRFQMKIADATAHVTAPSARYKLRLS